MTSASDTTRIKQWINLAMHDIDDQADWPYLQATTTGVTPLTIADLGTIEAVADTTGDRILMPVDRRALRDQYGDLTTTGTAQQYYMTGGNVISLYPAQASLTITVDYWKVGPDLSAGTDVPLMPDRYRYAIVDYAVALGMRDRGDLPGAQDARQQGDVRVAQMMQRLLLTQHQAAQDFVAPYGDDN
jgi:hypothetical protein